MTLSIPAMTRGIALAAGLLLAVSAARVAVAARPCAASCVTRMAACRAERCPAARGTDRRHCRDVCRGVTGCAAGAARGRTIATIVNECRSAGGMWTGRQRLEIKRGDCPPVTVMTIEANEPAPDPLGLCAYYGGARAGATAQTIGVFEGLAISLDGETVIFQLTDDFVGRLKIGDNVLASPSFKPAIEGIFVVHSDGSGLHRIADQSQLAPFSVSPSPSTFPPISIGTKDGNGFSFSPDGTSVVLGDRGPGADGMDAPQVFTLDPKTGERRQLTTFNASSVEIPGGLWLEAWFLDDEQIGGWVYDRETESRRIFRLRRDGKGFQFFDPHAPVVVEGASIDPTFRVSGFLSDVFELVLPGMTDQPVPGRIRELFVQSGRNNLLQVTRIGRSDTKFPLRLRGRQNVLFVASGDPLTGRNPSFTCQLFSVDVLGGHLRQLTSFDPHTTVSRGCRPSADGCTLADSLSVQDQVTGTIVFDSSCAAFDSSPVGQQVYAVRPDGSGLRRLTDYRGMTIDPDGAVNVELPGPIVYQAPLK
jgi:hypothetical protein